MVERVQKILEQALKLPRSGRAKLLKGLISSLETAVDSDAEDPRSVEEAWRTELARRIDDVEQGRVRLIPSKKLHADVRRAVARRSTQRRA